MEMTLSPDTIKAIARETADILERRMRRRAQPEMITTSEAAALLGIKSQRMRQIADRYPHTKKGDGQKQGQLLFVRDAILKSIN